MSQFRKYYTIKAQHPSGQWETVKLPRMFSVADLALVWQHSELYLQLPKGYTTRCNGQKVEGGANIWLHWDSTAKQYDIAYDTDPAEYLQNVS